MDPVALVVIAVLFGAAIGAGLVWGRGRRR